MSAPAPRRVALYGGSFDPPHVAHVLTVAWLLAAGEVDEVWVAPVGRHPLDKRPSPFALRRLLCVLAFEGLGERVRVIDDDGRRDASGRTFDLIVHLRALHPDVAFRFVLGTDQVAERGRWWRFDDIVRLAPPIVVGRPGSAGAPGLMPQIELPDVSSTAIRAALAAGRPVGGLVPAAVARLIEARSLYRGDADARAVSGLGHVGIVGAGRAGPALALALAAAGAPVARLWARDAERAAALAAILAGATAVDSAPGAAWAALDAVVFAVPDRALATAAAALAAAMSGGDAGARERPQIWLHLSGVRAAAALDGAGAVATAQAGGVSVALAGCHPLAALPDVVALARTCGAAAACADAIAALRGATFAIAGEPAAEAYASALVAALGGDRVALDESRRAAWHAAAAVVANDLVALLAIGAELAGQAGVGGDEARRGHLHLAATALRAVDRAVAAPGGQLADGLTGAVARGDADTLTAHIAAMGEASAAAGVHRLLSARLVELVAAAGTLDADRISAMRAALAGRRAAADPLRVAAQPVAIVGADDVADDGGVDVDVDVGADGER